MHFPACAAASGTLSPQKLTRTKWKWPSCSRALCIGDPFAHDFKQLCARYGHCSYLKSGQTCIYYSSPGPQTGRGKDCRTSCKPAGCTRAGRHTPQQAVAAFHLVRCECGSIARGALTDDNRCTNALGSEQQEHGHTLCSRCRPPTTSPSIGAAG